MKLPLRRDTTTREGGDVIEEAFTSGVVPVPDQDDLGRLYVEHGRRIQGLLMRLGVAGPDAEDALHDVFEVASRRLSTLRDPGAIRAWLNGIAVRVAASSRRRARFRRFVGLERVPEPSDARTPATDLERQRARAAVYAALDGIKEKKRTVFILFELQGMSGQEIAEAVGCPLKTVWTRLFHARREFLVRLAEIEGGEEAG